MTSAAKLLAWLSAKTLSIPWWSQICTVAACCMMVPLKYPLLVGRNYFVLAGREMNYGEFCNFNHKAVPNTTHYSPRLQDTSNWDLKTLPFYWPYLPQVHFGRCAQYGFPRLRVGRWILMQIITGVVRYARQWLNPSFNSRAAHNTLRTTVIQVMLQKLNNK